MRIIYCLNRLERYNILVINSFHYIKDNHTKISTKTKIKERNPYSTKKEYLCSVKIIKHE